MDDDWTREYAVRELGEDAVRALEVEVVKAHADRLSPGTFVAMGIPTASILEGLGREQGPPAPTRRENDGPVGPRPRAARPGGRVERRADHLSSARGWGRG